MNSRIRFARSILILGLAAETASAQPSGPYRNLSQPTHATVTDYEVKVPMRDGVHLVANIVRPKSPGRFPVVVSYIPYGKEPDSYFAERGYVAVFAEGRGTGTSEGTMADYFDAQSFRDGYDLVEWVARQSWSNGQVGLWGISFGAINATRVAALGPPHLKAIAINSAYANFFGDHWYPGGVRTNHPYVWHGASNVLYTMLRGPVYDDGKGGKVLDVDRWKRRADLNGWRAFFQPQWEHAAYDGYWQEKDLRSKYPSFAVPTLQIGNYFDHGRNHDEVYQNYLVLKAKRVPQKLIVGPWTHGGFGPGPALDFRALMVAWFDQFLKGVETGIVEEPPVAVFVMRENRWRFEDDWPIERTRPTRYFLTSAGDLALTPPDSGAPRRYQYRPWVGSAAGPYGTWFDAAYTDYLSLPDQRVDEAESLTFTTAPLAEDVEVTGMPEISFHAASTASNTDFTIKLSDVAPEGRSDLVTRGWLNSSYRESNLNPRRPEDWRFVGPSPIEPGRVYRYQVTLQNVAYRFHRGHRIRVTIASSDWPSNWPNRQPAENDIHIVVPGGGASSITLPIVPPLVGPRVEPRFPPAPPPPAPGPNRRDDRYWIETDLAARTVTYRAAATSDHEIPGGSMSEVTEWQVALKKEPPYDQVIDLTTTRTVRRPGTPNLRFVYRVRTDGNGPRATVEFTDEKVP
ncbi:MAG: CocE/NonD family hydrolase [Gemmatimonadales bacterium]